MNTTITHIFAGFLSGNLGLGEDCNTDFAATIQAYADACQVAIEAEYPGVEVEIDWQDASGTLPLGLQPSATGGSDRERAEVELNVRDILRLVFERGAFYRDIGDDLAAAA